MTPKVPRQSEAVSSFSLADFEKALDAHDYQFQPGAVVTGKVLEHASEGAYIDIGGKSLAFLPLREAALDRITDREELAELLPVNAEEDFLIIRDQNKEGQVTLSRRRLHLQRTWSHLAQLKADNQSLPVRVQSTNRGGVLVNVQGLRGFIPRSQLNHTGDLENLIGQTVTVGFLEVNPETNKLVLSEKLVSQVALASQFEVGQVVEGAITALKPFGAFVALEGSTGLLHIKQISQKFIASLADLFSVGQPIKAVIVEVDEMKGRISLSTRVLEKYPGEMLDDRPTLFQEAEDRARKLKGKLSQPTLN